MLCRIAGKSKADCFLKCPWSRPPSRRFDFRLPPLETILIEFLEDVTLFPFSSGFCFARSGQDVASLLMLPVETYVEVTAKPADSRPDERGNQKMIFVLIPDAKIADFRKGRKKQRDISTDAIAREIAEMVTPQVLMRKISSGPIVHGAWVIGFSVCHAERPSFLEGRSLDYHV